MNKRILAILAFGLCIPSIALAASVAGVVGSCLSGCPFCP